MKKTFYVIFLLCTIILLITSCGKENILAVNKMDTWLNNSNLSAIETPDELYQKALQEDTLVVYSDSTRVMDVKKSFEKKYPGLTVYVHDMRASDLMNMLKKNYESNKFDCDVVLCSDNTGIISNELVPQGIVYKYVPYDFVDKITPSNNQDVLNLMGEIQLLFYNNEVYDHPPLHNWWELTEENFRGKVIMPNPLKSISNMGLISMIIKNEKMMEDSYYNLYGKKLPLKSSENAGEIFIQKLIENDLVLVNSGDEVIELVGTPNQTSPPIGFTVSSKIRKKDIGYCIEPVFDMEYFCGTYSPNSIMLAGGCMNINSSKLFIRWILGESDGQGEGYKPYLTDGTWSVRTDVKSQSALELEDIKTLNLDLNYIHMKSDYIIKFWQNLVRNRK
jgi:iron(III) transport system substrate-binding protein